MTPEFGTPRTAIVTGGARRIGAAIARALAADGWHVLIHHHSSDASALAAELGLRDAEDQIEVMMLSDVQSKIVNGLLKLAQQVTEQSGGGLGVAISISPMELATRVGLDVDTVKRGVQQLREGNYIRVSDERLEIPDVDALEKLYGLLGLGDEIRGDSAQAC